MFANKPAYTVLLCMLFLASSFRVIAHSEPSQQSNENVVRVDTHKPIGQPFEGLGVQFDPFEYRPTPEKWAMITSRLTHCGPGYFRVVFQADAYCLGFDSAGAPIYAWKSAKTAGSLEQIYAILDYAQAHHVDVILGEWGPPTVGHGESRVHLMPADPRWPRIIADFVSYLRHTRGYSAIRYYNFINEPNGDWSGNPNYDTWVTGMRNLGKAFTTQGLSKEVRIIGPDTTGNTDWLEPFTWIERAAKDLPDVIGAYDLHWYAQDKEVLNGLMEPLLREKRRMALTVDPGAAQKPMFMGESGILTGRTNGDQQPRVRTFEYGVLMADYVAQIARAGWGGALAWDLDDAMHVNQGPATTPPGDHTLKLWGFWNSQGSAMGRPEEEKMRPWFTTWTLMARLFPRGSRIVQADSPDLPGFRAMAGTDAAGRQISVMLVNDSDDSRTVSVRVPGAGKRTLTRYNYFSGERPTDTEGFPKPATKISDSDLEQGLNVALPSRGVVLLTTRPSF